jgi:hypothetical protein
LGAIGRGRQEHAVKKSSHNRRRRPGIASDAEGRSRLAADDSSPLDADRVDLALAEEEVGDNDLAEATLKMIDRIRPYVGTILAGLAAALATFVAYGVVSSQAEATRTQSWDACLAAMSTGETDSFNEVIRRYPGTDAARWAELTATAGATRRLPHRCVR